MENKARHASGNEPENNDSSAFQLADWSEKIAFGLPGIDAQHKQLFDLAATFTGNGDQIRVIKTLAILNEYIRVHFKDEEDMLAESGYPDLEKHRQLHASFREMIAKLLKNARSMTLDEVADEVHQLINGWFYNHILAFDADYVPHVKARATASG